MTVPPLADQIFRRAVLAGIQLGPEELARLVDYYALLERWNQKINLTALPLAARDDSTIDRLIVEPLVALPEFDLNSDLNWMDFGSGGGSPALPIKLMRSRARVVMVEARERKSAFLREAVSNLALTGASVETCRVEALLDHHAPESIDLVTMRAVRLQPEVLAVARKLLKVHGRMLLFRGADAPAALEGFELLRERALLPSTGYLATFGKKS